MADQHIEITSEKPGDPLVKFSIGHDQLPKLKFKLDKPKKSGLSGLLERRRHSLASSDAPIGKKKENLIPALVKVTLGEHSASRNFM